MAAKDVRFHEDARHKMLEGINILANAFKFTEEGGRVSLSAALDPGGGRRRGSGRSVVHGDR